MCVLIAVLFVLQILTFVSDRPERLQRVCSCVDACASGFLVSTVCACLCELGSSQAVTPLNRFEAMLTDACDHNQQCSFFNKCLAHVNNFHFKQQKQKSPSAVSQNSSIVLKLLLWPPTLLEPLAANAGVGLSHDEDIQ